MHSAAHLGRADRLLKLAQVSHASIRGGAIKGLAHLGVLPEPLRLEALASPDPWLRQVAFNFGDIRRLLEHDPAPVVRRAALEALESSRRQLDADERVALGRTLASATDPVLRMGSLRLLGLSIATLPVILALTNDEDEGVRSVANEAFASHPTLNSLLDEALKQPDFDSPSRVSLYTQRLKGFDRPAFERWSHAFATETAPEVRSHLQTLALGFAPEWLRELPGFELPSTPAPAPRPPRPLSNPEVQRRPLGKTGLKVAPLGISGRYEPTPGMLFRAREAGVNLFFWEPSYESLTRFLRNSRAYRDDLVIAAGSYHADPAHLALDVERALKRLGTDHLDVFLLYWVRSPQRLSDEAFDCLSNLKQKGLIRSFGFSTHFRELAAQAIAERAWDVVMLRHSAAHPGAEAGFLPLAAERQVGVLTFSNLCYGRLLRTSPHMSSRPKAADCYRYSLSQPGVSACLSAPGFGRELTENLAVLDCPTLQGPAIEALRLHGRWVHAQSRQFNAWVRQAGRPALSAAGDALQALLLEAEQEARETVAASS